MLVFCVCRDILINKFAYFSNYPSNNVFTPSEIKWFDIKVLFLQSLQARTAAEKKLLVKVVKAVGLGSQKGTLYLESAKLFYLII